MSEKIFAKIKRGLHEALAVARTEQIHYFEVHGQTIKVRTYRINGRMRAWSDQIPGLILSGRPDLVMKDIPEALEVLVDWEKRP